MPHTNNSLFIRLAEGKELGLKLSQQSELKKGIDSGTWIFRSGDFSCGRFVLPNFFHF